MISYFAAFDPDPKTGVFVVTVPDIPECVTQGDTFDEAMDMAQDVIAMELDHRIRHNLEIPISEEALRVLGKRLIVSTVAA